MKLGAGLPMGPIELLDYVGLDNLEIYHRWFTKTLSGRNLVSHQ